MIQLITYFIALALLLAGCTEKRVSTLVEMRDKNAHCDIQFVYSTIELPNRPLTLEDIIDIAWVHNFDTLAKELEWEVQKEVTTREMLRMLPALAFNMEKSERNKNTAARSLNIPSDILTPYQIGSSRKVRVWDVTLSWQILDFALAYFRSQEESWRALNVYMQYARLKQNLILEVYRSYWKAVSARWARDQSSEILKLVADFRSRFDRDMEARLISQVPGLKVEDQLLGFQVQLYSFEYIFHAAKAELSALMGLPVDVEFELAPVEMGDFPEIECLEELEDIALHSRPELYGGDFDEMISVEQVRQAAIKVLPGVELFKGYHENKDPFLLHHHWIVQGIRAAWDLLALPTHAFDIKAAKVGRDRAYISRVALSVGIIAQVNIAYWDYQNITQQYKIRQDVYNVRNRLASATWDQFYRGEFNMVDYVVARGNAIQSGVDMINAYAQREVALEQLNNSIGQPLRFNNLPPTDINETMCSEETP